MTQFFLVDFDALGERAEVIAAVAAAIDPHARASCPVKRFESRWLIVDRLAAAGVEFIDPADRMGSGRALAGGPLTGWVQMPRLPSRKE